LKEYKVMTMSRPAITNASPAAGNARSGVILFAHGARDARWAEPFARVAEKLRASAPGLPVETAFLEFMPPDLATAANRLVERGVTTIRVIPLFFGRGGHLRAEVPRLIAEIGAALPGVTIDLGPAAGDDERVIDALAAFCLSEALVR
jgi:sirohydrochlorin cobaltochelatase